MRWLLWWSIFIAATGCAEDTPATLIVRLQSDLGIGDETNGGAVRVRSQGRLLEQSSFELGTGARARWPQTLPIVGEGLRPERVTLEIELLWTTPGRPSAVVGYIETTTAFPQRDVTVFDVSVPRACDDEDEDGYGVGFGCEQPDCDDQDPEVPSERFCDASPPPASDAGVGTGTDAGTPSMDTGAGGGECAGERCASDEVCFANSCARSCQENRDCPEVHLGCLRQYGVCQCRIQCFDGSNNCGSMECKDGCCQP